MNKELEEALTNVKNEIQHYAGKEEYATILMKHLVLLYKAARRDISEDMVKAGVKALSDSGLGDVYDRDAIACYEAMTAEAPSPNRTTDLTNKLVHHLEVEAEVAINDGKETLGEVFFGLATFIESRKITAEQFADYWRSK